MSRHLLRLRRSRGGVSTVIANALMVATTVGMAGSFFLMVSNLISPYTPPTVSFLALQVAGTYASETPDYCCLNDTFIQVAEVGGDTLFWAPPVQYQIRDSTGALIIRGDLEPAPEDDVYLGVYHAGPGYASLPVIGYVDVKPLNEVSQADTIQVFGMSEEYHGAQLQVLQNGRMLADITLE